MANKITTIIDFVTDGAQRSVKSFRQSVTEAEGATNKFKAGASNAMATVQANAGALALGAGAALATFGAKSISAFQETALAAGKFSDASGIAIEDASRLQEVAGDLGVSSDAVAGTVVRLQKAVASQTDAVKQLGIETKRTKDGQVDVLGTYLDAIDKLGGVADANERALLASQLFGKGFADSAELILGDADDIKKRLDGVADAQVISDAQLARAKKFRDQMDDLSDSLKQVEITVGDQLVPVIGALADGLVGVEDAAKRANDALDNLPGDISLGGINRGQLGALGLFVKAVKDVKDELDGGDDSAAAFAEKNDRMTDSVLAGTVALDDEADAAAEAAEEVADLGDKAANSGPKIGDMAGALEGAREHLADLNQEFKDNALDEWAEAIQGVRDAIDDALGGLGDDLDELDTFDDITEAFEGIAEAQKNGKEGTRDYNRAVRDLQRELLGLVETRDDLSANEKIEFAARIRQGDIDALKLVLDDLTKDRWINVGVRGDPQQAFSSIGGTFAPGQAPTPIINGANPAPTGGGYVDNRNITIINPIGSTPTTTYIDTQTDFRRNGPR